MKTDLQSIKDAFQMGYDAYEDSYYRADEVFSMAKGKMYTQTQLRILKDRGQPAEHFNVIELFNRSLQGYFSSVVSTMHAKSIGTANVENANTINLGLEYHLRLNDWEILKDKLQISGYNAGVMNLAYTIKTVGKDQFGRNKNEINLEYIPYYELVRDPKVRKADYSDGRFIHRYRWIADDELEILFPGIDMKKMSPYSNETGVEAADFHYTYSNRFVGQYQVFNEYLIVHSEVVDNKGDTWQVWWSGDYELKRQRLEFDSLRFSLRSILIETEDETDPSFSGIYKDVTESQKAINQAILQIQQLANGSKVLVEGKAVKDIDEFQTQWARVNAAIPVAKLAGIEVIEFSRDIAAQYNIIDQALSRIQQVLHINDAFLGNAYSQDSGKKVALQKNSSMMALRYISVKLDALYRYIGLDVIYLMRQYVNATMSISKDDNPNTETAWEDVNTPLQDPNTGQPITQMYMNEKNQPVQEIVNDPTRSFLFDRMDIKVESIPYDTDDTADKLMLNQTLEGGAGQMIMNANPGEYLKGVSLLTREFRTKNSGKIADWLDEMAVKMGAMPWRDPRVVETPELQGGQSQPNQATGAQQIGSTMGLDNNVQNK